MKKTLITLAALAAASVAVAAVPTPDKTITNPTTATGQTGIGNATTHDYSFSLVLDMDAVFSSLTAAGTWENKGAVALSNDSNWWQRGILFYNNPNNTEATPEDERTLVLTFNDTGSIAAPQNSSTTASNLQGHPLYSMDDAYNGKLALTFVLKNGTSGTMSLYVTKNGTNGGLAHDVYTASLGDTTGWAYGENPWSKLTANDPGNVYSSIHFFNSALNADEAKAVNAQLIPEPATATLSLLALAGLAARRRRK